MDAGALNVPFLANKALRMANADRLDLQPAQVPAAQVEEVGRDRGRIAGMRHALNLGLGRTQAYPDDEGAVQGDAAAVDQAIGRESGQQRTASLLNRARTASRSEGEQAGGGQNAAPGKSALDPTLGLGAGTKKSKGGAEEKFSKAMVGGFIRACWGALWLTWGHAIYCIDILFLIQAGSKYMRKYIPAVGEEWFPPAILEKIPKVALLPLKLGELTGMIFVTFFVMMLDLIFLSIVAFFLGLILDISRAL